MQNNSSESQATRYYRGIKYEYISKLKEMKITETDSNSVVLKYAKAKSLSYRGNNYQQKAEEKINITQQIAKKSSLKYRGQSCEPKNDQVRD